MRTFKPFIGIHRCEGSFCDTLTGTCTLPLPWFCNAVKDNDNAENGLDHTGELPMLELRYCRNDSHCAMFFKNQSTCCDQNRGVCAAGKACESKSSIAEKCRLSASQKIKVWPMSCISKAHRLIPLFHSCCISLTTSVYAFATERLNSQKTPKAHALQASTPKVQ